jgi:hypothetical protein
LPHVVKFHIIIVCWKPKKSKHLYICKVYSCILGCLGKSQYGPLQLQNSAPNLYFYSCNIATYNPLIFSPNSHKGFASHNPLSLVLQIKNIKETLLPIKLKLGQQRRGRPIIMIGESENMDQKSHHIYYTPLAGTQVCYAFSQPQQTVQKCKALLSQTGMFWLLFVQSDFKFQAHVLSIAGAALIPTTNWYGVASSMLFVCHLFVIFTCRAMGMMKLIFLSNIKRGIRWF